MIRLGVPSKGRLMEKTFDWFGKHGLTLSRTGSDREYAGRVDGADIALVLNIILITAVLSMGVTGSDLVREKLTRWNSKVETLARMDFGHADLILAVPKVWIDVDTLDDLDAAAAQFRARHGHRLRIATKYHRQVREFLQDNGVADYQLVDSQGATEGTVLNHTAEMIADITSTGETLRANHLKVLSDGMIHASQATLFRSRTAKWTKSQKTDLDDLRLRLGV